MTAPIVVFLGPSLPVDEARAVLDARFLPPAAQGDVLGLLLGPGPRPAAIVVIDGYFDAVPSVWHKEVLAALDAGVAVYGGASMGALRAAELDRYGMVGVGEIYRAYADGELTDDDEVAVRHTVEVDEATGAVTYRRTSVAMVDLREAVATGVAEGLLTPEVGGAVVATAKALPYPERTHRRAARLVADAGGDADALERWAAWATDRPGAKARDALAVLTRVREDADSGFPDPRRDAPVPRTAYLVALEREVLLERRRSRGPGEPEPVARKKALLRLLARAEADRHGWVVTPAELTDMVVSFRASHGLLEPGDLERWMAEEGLTGDELERFLVDACLVERLERSWEHELGPEVARQLAVDSVKRFGRAQP